MILTRYISASQFGSWALFLIITSIFEATKTNLLKNAHVKYVSGTNDKLQKIAVASSSLVINFIINSIFILVIIFFSGSISQWLNAGNDLSIMLFWFIPGLIFMVFFSHLESVQQSHFDFKGVFAGYFIRQAFFLLMLLVHISLNIRLTLSLLAIYQSLSIALGAVTIYIYSKSYLANKFIFSSAWAKKILGYGGYIFGSGLVANIANNLDQIMIARFIPGTVAYYNVASRVNNLVDIPSYAASDIIFPKTSLAIAEEGIDRVKYLFEKMAGTLLAITIPIALFIILLPKFIIISIAGKGYVAAAGILQLYMITGILRPAQNQAANLLNSIGKTKITFTLNSIFFILLILINYICLKKIGFYGAAIGTLITTSISFVMWYFVMRKEIRLNIKNVFFHIINTYQTIWQYIRKYLRKEKQYNKE